MNKLTLLSDYLARPGAEEELLRAVVPRTHRTDDGLFDFGLPSAFEDRKRERRERIYRHCYRVGMVIVLLWIGFAVGYNIHGYLAAH